MPIYRYEFDVEEAFNKYVLIVVSYVLQKVNE